MTGSKAISMDYTPWRKSVKGFLLVTIMSILILQPSGVSTQSGSASETPPLRSASPTSEQVFSGNPPLLEPVTPGGRNQLAASPPPDESKPGPDVVAPAVVAVTEKAVVDAETPPTVASPAVTLEPEKTESPVVDAPPKPVLQDVDQTGDISVSNNTEVLAPGKNASKPDAGVIIKAGIDETGDKDIKDGENKAIVTGRTESAKQDGEATEAPPPIIAGPAAGAGGTTAATPTPPIPTVPSTSTTTSTPAATISTAAATTTSTTSTTTTASPEPVATTIVVVDPPAGKTEPPYVHVSETSLLPAAATTPRNSSLVGPPPEKKGPFSPKLIAIIVGAAVGLIAVIIIITVVVCVIRRKKRRHLKDIPIIENPRYMSANNSEQPHNYRFSRDASLMIGGPHHLANNNHNEKNDMNSIRKKRRAPPAPNPFTGELETFPLNHDGVEYYEKFPTSKRKAPAPPVPSSSNGERNDTQRSLSNPYSIEYFEQLSRNKRRKAPPPPNPFTGEVDAFINPHSIEYMDQDSPQGSEVELTTFGIKPSAHPFVAPELPRHHPAAAAMLTNNGDNDDETLAESTAATAGTITPDHDATHTDFSDTEDEGERSMEELEGRALLDDIERETGFRIAPIPGSGKRDGDNRKSLADKYQFSDDEEARDAHDYKRSDYRDAESVGSEDDLGDDDGAALYDVSDITDVTDNTLPRDSKLMSAPNSNVNNNSNGSTFVTDYPIHKNPFES